MPRVLVGWRVSYWVSREIDTSLVVNGLIVREGLGSNSFVDDRDAWVIFYEG